MNHLTKWLVAIGLTLTASVAGAQSLDAARAAVDRADTETAEALIDALDDDDAANRLRARLRIDAGALDDAEDLIGDDDTPEGLALRGEVLVLRGAYEDAVELLDPAVEGGETPYPPARYWRGRALDAMGRASRARFDFEDFAREYQRNQIDTAEGLVWAARAMMELDRYQDANTLLREALEREPEAVHARLVWAELFLSKYRPDEARALLDEILTRNPNHARALALQGRAVLDHVFDLTLAKVHALQALAIDPELPEALLLMAEIAIDSDAPAMALDYLEDIDDDGPSVVEALTLEAAVAYLLDDTERYEALEREVLSRPGRHAAFYHQIGEHASRVFRYEESLALQEHAIALDAGFWPAYISLGVAYSRMGDDERALSFLQRAFDADPFNASAYYMVTLYEQTLAEYTYVADPIQEGLRYRFHRDESELLSHYVPEATRDVFALYQERHHFTPEMPLSVEVFSDAETFGVRSVGLPMEGLQGVCFGHVVTSHSPSEANFNWRLVLEHEMSHVFTLQRSNYRVPRWLTEGMAEYDTLLTDGRWRREEELSMVSALSEDRLISVGDLTAAFTTSTNLGAVVTAYYQASQVVRFIAETWTYDALLAMLDAYAAGSRTPEVIESVLEIDVAAFDERFEAWLRDELGSLAGLWEPDLYAYGDVVTYTERAEASPNDPEALAERGIAELLTGDLETSTATLERALELDPGQPLAHLVLGQLAYELGDYGPARSHLEQAIADGRQSYTVLVMLGHIARDTGRHDDAIALYQQATALYPRGPEPLRALADLLPTRGDEQAAFDVLERLVDVDENDFGAAFRLAQTLSQRGQTARALEAIEWAAQVAPFDRDLHTLYGRLAHASQRWDRARRELELELAAGPLDRATTIAALLETYDALGLSEEAARLRQEVP